MFQCSCKNSKSKKYKSQVQTTSSLKFSPNSIPQKSKYRVTRRGYKIRTENFETKRKVGKVEDDL